MATETKPVRRLNLNESHQRVRHPLQSLRNYIRMYVAIECAALVLLFLTAWFWIGLVLDWGVFKLTSLTRLTLPLDWVDSFPVIYYFLLGLLALCVVGLVAYKAGVRLLREFSDPALALLLERRFPKLLGDRLITAVELADVKKAARYGYSAAMIEQTIHDAAERVDQVPVREVFNWTRLVFHGAVLLIATLGVYLMVGAICCVFAATRENSTLAGFGNLNDVGGKWFERNLLLRKSYWDRSAYLILEEPRAPYQLTHTALITMHRTAEEVPETVVQKLGTLEDKKFQTREQFLAELATVLDKDELERYQKPILKQAELEIRVGRDKASTELKVRYVGWVVPDDVDHPRGRYGWRPLERADLTPELLGTDSVPAIPARWNTWTVDSIDAELAGMDIERLQAVKEVVSRVDALTKDPRVTRRKEANHEGLHIQDASPLAAALGMAQTATAVQGTPLPVVAYAAKAGEAMQWRPLLWSDVQRLAPQYLGGDVPDLPTRLQGLNVDQVERELADMEADKLPRLKADLFERLKAQAARRDMRHQLRKLETPENVEVLYWNTKAKIDTDQKLQKHGNDQYTVTLNELHDNVTFRIRAGDFYTPDGTIVVVPAPSFETFSCDQYKPAYIFYRLETGDNLGGNEVAWRRVSQLRLQLGGLLSGAGQTSPLPVLPWLTAKPLDPLAYKRQLFADYPLPAISGEVTKVPPVPVGSHLVIKGKVDRDLAKMPRLFKVATTGKDAGIFPPRWEVSWSAANPREFSIRLDDIRTKQEFVFEIEDHDNVSARREVLVEAKEDLAPEVEVQLADYVRQIREDFDYKELKLDAKAYGDLRVMTVGAWLPLVGKIKDDHGLTEVNLVYTVTPLDARVVPGKGDPLAGSGNFLTGGFGLASLANQFRVLTPQGGPQRTALRRFVAQLAKRPGVRVQLLDLDNWLNHPQDLARYEQRWKDRDPVSVLDQFEDLDPAAELDSAFAGDPQSGLDLRPLNLLEPTDSRRVQGKYLLSLEVEAYDTDVEAQPAHRGVNKVRFNVLLVSEAELLSLIGREEEKLHLDLKKVVDDLEENEQKLSHAIQDLALLQEPRAEDPDGKKNFYRALSSMRTHMGSIVTALDDEQAGAAKVSQAYERILHELYGNRVQRQWINKIESYVVTPLKKIADDDYRRTKDEIVVFHGKLNDTDQSNPKEQLDNARKEGDIARAQVKDLHDNLKRVLDNMEGITDLTKEIRRLQAILEKSQDQGALFQKTKQQLEDEILRRLGGGDAPKDK